MPASTGRSHSPIRPFARPRLFRRLQAGIAPGLLAWSIACGGDVTPSPVPSEIAAVSGDGQRGTVATMLADPIVVRVSDDQGRPISGASVTWTTTDPGGSLDPASSVTDDQGRASTRWTLGTQAGPTSVRVQLADVSLPPVTLSATAEAGAPARIEVASGDAQEAEVGEVLIEPLEARVTDAWENPVRGARLEWTGEEGSGSLSTRGAPTDSGGIATATWRLPTRVGSTEATARVRGADSIETTFSATALPSTLNLTIPNAYFVQAVQRLDGDVPLVAGRDAILRVFVEANRITSQRPSVRVRLRDGDGALLLEESIHLSNSATLGPGISEFPRNTSHNLLIPGELIAPGLRAEFEVNPNGSVVETSVDDNTLPNRGEEWLPLVEEAPPLEITFVPIRVGGSTGSVPDPANFATWATGLFPIHRVDAEVRAEALHVDGLIVFQSDANELLSQIAAARLADGSDHYYYGVLPREGDRLPYGVATLASPVSMGTEGAFTILAHELGHNWGRRHACASAPGPDPDYPNADGTIGVYGFDVRTNEFYDRESIDIMGSGYCGSPPWIGDYTYEAVLDFRRREAQLRPAQGSPQPSLIVWGRVEGDSLILEPSFRAHVRPSLPTTPGSYRIEGVDERGGPAFDLRFAPSPIADGSEGAAAFAFAVPLEESRALSRIRLTDGARSAEMRAPPTERSPRVVAESVGGDDVRLLWDGERYPMLVVRDPASGRVIQFARGGEARVRVPAGGRVSVEASDGVNGRRVEPIRR